MTAVDPSYTADVAARDALLAWHRARAAELTAEAKVEELSAELLDQLERLGGLLAIDAAIVSVSKRWELPNEIRSTEERVESLRSSIPRYLEQCRPQYRANVPRLVRDATLAEVPVLVAVSA